MYVSVSNPQFLSRLGLAGSREYKINEDILDLGGFWEEHPQFLSPELEIFGITRQLPRNINENILVILLEEFGRI